MSDSLTQHLVQLLARPITAEDRQRAALHVLDWLGCAILGYRSPVGQKLAAFVKGQAQSGECSTLFAPSSDWQSALWLNAAVGNVAEMDDVHRTSILHPGPVVIPTALAAAQKQGATARQFLDAVVVGYEATIRIGRALGADHYQYYHNTSSCGTFGAAAAVASILNLIPDQQVWALGNAGSRTGGLWQMRNEAVDTKQFHNVDAALTGSLAAYMAAEDIKGPTQILEGPQGFFAATSSEATPEAVNADPGAPWLIYDCSFKPWPACRHTHAAIDAVRELALSDEQLENIQSLTIATYNDALVFCDRPNPETELHAKFSLQQAAAVCLLEGIPELEHFKPEYFNGEKIRAMRNKVQVELSESIQSVYPEHYGATVEITFSDGSARQASVTDAWGDPQCPMSETQLKNKAETLMLAGELDEETAKELIAQTLQLPEAENLSAFINALP